jgi:hypothetical protein
MFHVKHCANIAVTKKGGAVAGTALFAVDPKIAAFELT